MTQRTRRIISIISILLSVTIVLSLPIDVLATTLPKDEKVYSSFENVQGETESVGNIVAELTDERTETTKNFLLDDGTEMIAEYNQPVHYKNSKGKWVEYNNSLEKESSISTADEATNIDYTNKNSNIDIKLSNKAKANNMIKVTSDDYSISWGYDGANKSKICLVKNEEKFNGNEKFTTLKNITSEAKYENVYKNVDLQYFVTSTGVKENIILKSSDVQNEFNLTYKIENLTAKQTDDYTITLFNKSNKEVYTIVAPYMTDAKGDSSVQLKLELVSQKGSNLKVKLTADYWFIHSIGRSFPINIDPELTNKLSGELRFNEAEKNGYLINHGPYYNTNNDILVANVTSLQTLERGERIISAKYNFEITNSETLFESENDADIIVNAHKITALSSSHCQYESNVLDYDSLTYNDNHYLTVDLTKLYKEWYDNGDLPDGFVLESTDTIGERRINFQQSTKLSLTPSLTLVYKDFSGTESNLSYHTISLGNNAQASVSDFLGNLVINQSLLEETGARMPLSLSASFNSFYNDTNFEEGSPCGYGWQFSFNQYVREINDANLTKNGYGYKYLDSEGTIHYLKLAEGKTDEWIDEDGYGLTLTKDENNIYIDNGTTKQTYETTAAGGKLLSEKDEHNNTITYNYSNGKITSITDGAGRTTSFTYGTSANGETRITEITKPDNNTITLNYVQTYVEHDVISSITFSDGSKSEYNYDNYERITSVVHSKNATQIDKYTFEYSNNYEVIKIKEYGSDNTEGNYLNITYGNDNTTVFTDRRGRSETHSFDNSGSTVSVLNANGYIKNGSSSGLTVSGGADSYTKNYITQSTEQTEVKSGGYYYKTNGARNSTTSSGGTVTTDSSEPSDTNGQVQYFGTTSIKVNNPKSSTNSAFFTGATHQIDSTEFNGKDITFSAYVKTKNIEQIYSGGPIGATLKIKCYDSSGAALKDVNSIGLTGTLDWQRLSISVKVPENTSRIRIFCNLRYASGTAWFDCLQLEEGNCANDFNALQNSDFENNEYWLTNENQPVSAQNGTVTINGEAGAYDNAEDWSEETTAPESETEEIQPATYYETVTETAPNDSITTYDDYGNAIKTEQGFVNRTVKKTYEVEPATEAESESPAETPDDNTSEDTDTTNTSESSLGNKYIYQNVNVGRAGVNFNIVGEAQAKSVPLSNENRTFGIALNIYYENNAVPELHYQEFNAETSKKQTVSMSVTPENETEEISYVSFAFVYGNNKNTMTACNASLNISSVGYGVNSADDEASGDSSVGSDDTEDIDNYVDYEVISESVDKNQTYMQTDAVYDSAGNYVVTETDESGSTVSYTYDVNGNVTSVTDGEENVVNYTYDNNDQITSVKGYEDAENSYAYDEGKNISTITHNNFSYKFNYDVFSNLISTKIGNTAIVSNTYSTNNGNLTKTAYANGDYIEYTYDEYDNITKLTSEEGVIAEFVYNKKGMIVKAVDNSSETTTYYYHDFSGGIICEYRQTEGGDLSYYFSYDADGNRVEKTSINGQTKTITSGTDDDGKSFVSNDGVTAESTTDDFGRTTEVKTSLGEGRPVFFTNYGYYGGRTSNRVAGLTQTYGADELVKYQYTYDGNGNIEQVRENGVVTAKYTYDELKQLVWSGDKNTNLYTQMVYDNAGNITRVDIYSLGSNWAPVKLLESRTYTYNDTNWCDKLTGYNGTTITYDAVGNPLSYRDGMTMSWQNGRQLAALQTADNSVAYKYDSNGMRTRKSDSNGTTNYYYDSNNNLIGLTKGNNTLLFYYDSNDEVTSFKYNGEIYYYIKNLQGDIVKIIDRSGAEAASYKYDSWGKITAESGSSVIRELNPFRYRGYVYDTETGLYYLQSRYYDPITGRFINADIYCDTGSGNPLSTNMFAYCENNSITYVDHTGYWDTPDHKNITNDQGFSGKTYENVRNWTYNADTKGFASTDKYSAPFHGRDNSLEIGKCLYNLAVDVKKNKKKYKFSDSSYRGYYKLPDILKYKPKNKNKKDHKKAAAEATANFISTLNNAKNYTVQWQILLGLALHTFQDYSAHVIKVDLISSTNAYYPSKYAKNISHHNHGKPIMMHKVDDTMGLPNSAIEDNKNVLKWRYTFAKDITKLIYRSWTSNKKFDKFYTVQGEVYKDAYSYKRTTGYGRSTKYWRIYSMRCYCKYTYK